MKISPRPFRLQRQTCYSSGSHSTENTGSGGRMDEDTSLLKARDLADRTGLPEADVKRYLRTFNEFFRSVKQGKTKLYTAGTAERLKQRAELEAMGTTVPSIRGILMAGQVPGEGTGETAQAASAGSMGIAGETLTLGALSNIKTLQETIGDLQAEVASLKEKVLDHDQKIIGHQQQIRLLRHDVDEQKTDALARKMEGKNSPVWKRIFH